MSSSTTDRSKWKRVLLAVCVLLTVAISAGIAWLYSTVAPDTGTFTVRGLEHQVEIRFDAHQRPFVRAETLADALLAQGWLHAHHRLWQMELLRRAGQGRLAELLGSSMLESDRELWRMGVPQLARRLQENASPELQRYVAAYVNGVNAAIDSGESKPPEFLLLRTSAEPWRPDDVYALGALMAFQSANNADNELLRLALFDEIGAEGAEIFLPSDGGQADFPYVVAGGLQGGPPLNPRLFPRRGERGASTKWIDVLERRQAIDPLHHPLMPRFGLGSNGWVVAPEKSATGNALFAFDSHDALGLPNLFYEVHLFFADDRQIRGWSVAGLPGVINGYNDKVAWGFTNIGDSQDLFLETRSAADPLQFKDGDDWYVAETETVEIPVNGRSDPELLTIIHTRNGPLISEDPPISLRWTVQDLGGRGLDSILNYNLAQSCQEFAAALDGLAAPALNATFADVAGNIGFRTAGLIPLRGAGQGLLPQDGSQPANRWQGYVPPDQMPTAFDPEHGFLAAANARVSAEGQAPLISADNAPGYRIRRIHQVLAGTERLTADQMRSLQVDWYDTQAALLMPAMIDGVERAALSPLERRGLAALEAWEGDWMATPESSAAILFQAWYRALAIEVFRPALGEALFAQLFRNNYVLNHALDRLILVETQSQWWRDARSPIVTRALAAAVAEVAAVQGDEADAWRLDRMHRVRLGHELGNAVPALSWLFNARPAPWGGGPSTVGRARYRYDRAYDATAGATVRVVGEMTAAGPVMAAVIPGGQSGHPLSGHYSDQFSQWLDGKLLPIAADFDTVSKAQTQLLSPDPKPERSD